MTQARVTSTTLEVLVEASPSARVAGTAREVVHSVQEAPPAPTAGRRQAVVIVMG